MRNPVGQLIADKYRVTRHLAGGGLADVYEAIHEQIGQHFAIKILRRHFTAFPEVADRFLTEARAASAIGHPGIVQVFDIGKLDSGEPYLVMELLQGEDLCDLLQRRKKLPADEAVRIVLLILDALAAAHEAGVVHRDLKPENVVLVRGPAGQPWAKIVDFGIARLIQRGEGAGRQTGAGAVLGTPYYAAPEQARGVEDVDGRADIYAVGVILFEMVTGRLPYDGASITEIVAKVLTEPFPEARRFEPSVPVQLERAILRATLKRREQRYRTAQEFAVALRPLRGETLPVRGLTPVAGVTPLSAPAPGRAEHPPAPPRLEPPSLGVLSIGTPPPLRPLRGSLSGTSAATSSAMRRVVIAATIGATVAAIGVTLLLWYSNAPGEAEQEPLLPGGGSPVVDTPASRTTGPAGTLADVAPGLPAVPRVDRPPLADAASPLLPSILSVLPASAQADIGPPPEGSARVTLVGLPPGAVATVDGTAVGAEFVLPISEVLRALRVTARGYEPFVQALRVGGETTIRVQLRRVRRGTGPDAVPSSESDGGPASLANPFVVR
jgi:serine/threonine protein kinase